jgi:hypothetical protein
MDFTYIIAGFLGLLAGLLLGSIFAFLGLTAKRVLVSALAPTIIADAILLINWRSVGAVSPIFVLPDFFVIALFSFLGSCAGVLPALATRHILRYREEKRVRAFAPSPP